MTKLAFLANFVLHLVLGTAFYFLVRLANETTTNQFLNYLFVMIGFSVLVWIATKLQKKNSEGGFFHPSTLAMLGFPIAVGFLWMLY